MLLKIMNNFIYILQDAHPYPKIINIMFLETIPLLSNTKTDVYALLYTRYPKQSFTPNF